MSAVTFPIWCTECGRHMVKSFTRLALVCPDGCRTMIVWEAVENVDELFDHALDFDLSGVVRAELWRALEREVGLALEHELFGNGTEQEY